MRPEAESEPDQTARGPAPPKADRPQPGSVAVVLRFGVRMLILLAFASIGTVGFARTLEPMLAMAAIYCCAMAPLRREAPFGPTLTHFDEATAYALCALVVSKAA
jgi:hypothetical protein